MNEKFIIIGIIFVFLMVGFSGCNDTVSDNEYEESAWNVAKDSILDRLKAPSTATIHDPYYIEYFGYDNWTLSHAYTKIKGHLVELICEVDAQNSYGAMIRETYHYTLVKQDNGDWWSYPGINLILDETESNQNVLDSIQDSIIDIYTEFEGIPNDLDSLEVHLEYRESLSPSDRTSITASEEWIDESLEDIQIQYSKIHSLGGMSIDDYLISTSEQTKNITDNYNDIILNLGPLYFYDISSFDTINSRLDTIIDYLNNLIIEGNRLEGEFQFSTSKAKELKNLIINISDRQEEIYNKYS